MSIAVTTKNFNEEVLKSKIPVLVDFWSERCMPCKMLAPVLAELETELGGTLKIAKANVDEDIDLAMKHDVSSIPAMFLFKDGQIIDSVVGYRTKEYLKEFVNEAL